MPFFFSKELFLTGLALQLQASCVPRAIPGLQGYAVRQVSCMEVCVGVRVCMIQLVVMFVYVCVYA